MNYTLFQIMWHLDHQILRYLYFCRITMMMIVHIISATWKGTRGKSTLRRIIYAPFISSTAVFVVAVDCRCFVKPTLQFVRKILYACMSDARWKCGQHQFFIIFFQKFIRKWSFPPFEAAGVLCIHSHFWYNISLNSVRSE